MSEFDSIFKHTALTVNYVQDIGVHLQEVGREYGTTTGRRRRCGWLDLVVMQHSCLINGYDSLNLTKLDILDDLEEINVAVKYVIDGKELSGFPGTFFVPKHMRSTFADPTRVLFFDQRTWASSKRSRLSM